MQQVQIFKPRRKKMSMGIMGINVIHKSYPWVSAWWSIALPGLGHINQGMYIKGFILMAGEIGFNLLGHVNEAIYYTFLGQFQKANQVLNHQWTTMYCAIFVFSIFDSYRVMVEINKMSWLESKQTIRDFTKDINRSLDLNFLDKRIPWVSAAWSAMFTGLGHIYCHRILTGFLLMGWTIAIIFYTRLDQLIMFTLTGQFHRLHEVNVNYEWVLFFPSIYVFGVYDAYVQTVTYNSLYKEEQVYYLKTQYGENPVTLEYELSELESGHTN